jgi:hypothetical protein
VPFTDKLTMHLTSKGSGVDAIVIMTFDGGFIPIATVTACIG